VKIVGECLRLFQVQLVTQVRLVYVVQPVQLVLLVHEQEDVLNAKQDVQVSKRAVWAARQSCKKVSVVQITLQNMLSRSREVSNRPKWVRKDVRVNGIKKTNL